MMHRRDSFNGSVSFVVSSVYVDAELCSVLVCKNFFFFFFGLNFVVYGSYRSGISMNDMIVTLSTFYASCNHVANAVYRAMSEIPRTDHTIWIRLSGIRY